MKNLREICFSMYLVIFMLIINVKGSLKTMDFDAFSDIARAFGEIAGASEDCVFECPNFAKPVPKPGHKPTSNGCGSYGIQISTDDLPGMEKCCNKHDICYDTCGEPRKECDTDFRSCLDNICTKLRGSNRHSDIKSCRSTSNLLYAGAVTLGCDAYMNAQKNACTCPKSNRKLGKPAKNEL